MGDGAGPVPRLESYAETQGDSRKKPQILPTLFQNAESQPSAKSLWFAGITLDAGCELWHQCVFLLNELFGLEMPFTPPHIPWCTHLPLFVWLGLGNTQVQSRPSLSPSVDFDHEGAVSTIQLLIQCILCICLVLGLALKRPKVK